MEEKQEGFLVRRSLNLSKAPKARFYDHILHKASNGSLFSQRNHLHSQNLQCRKFILNNLQTDNIPKSTLHFSYSLKGPIVNKVILQKRTHTCIGPALDENKECKIRFYGNKRWPRTWYFLFDTLIVVVIRLATCPEKCLGVPVWHSCASRKTCQFIIDKIKHNLATWKAA